MNRELKNIIRDDVFRNYGGKQPAFLSKALNPKMRFLKAFRSSQYCKNSVIKKYYDIKLRLMSRRYLIQIPPATKIGRGLYLGHMGSVIINADAILGNNVNIAPGVTIGQTNRGAKAGSPTIGNRVWIGTNAVIVGKISIGDDVLIAPNAYVNIDVPEHSIVIGNPAQIMRKENATESYINNPV